MRGDSGKSGERGLEPVARGCPSPGKAILVGQLRPVVRVGDTCSRRIDRLELPPPEVPRRLLTGLRGPPCDAPGLIELDHVILTDAAAGERHSEHLADSPDSLAGDSFGQIVVAVPPRLLSRVGNEFEDPPGAGRDLATCARNTRNLLVNGHADIEAPADSRPKHRALPSPRQSLCPEAVPLREGLLGQRPVDEPPAE